MHPTELAIEHYKGKFENSEAEKISNRITFASLSILIDQDLYYDSLEATSIEHYMWTTHETDSFYHYLRQGYRIEGCDGIIWSSGAD